MTEEEEFQEALDFENASKNEAPSESVKSSVPSKLESIGRGAAQGATAGFQDEASPYAEKMISYVARALGMEPKEVSDLYDKTSIEQLKNTYREQNDSAQKANPKSYMLGQLIGSAPASVAIGGTGIAGNAAANAALSGINTLGESTSSNLGDLAKQGGESALIGGAIGGTPIS